jgi:hypothetical protein
MKKQRDLQFCIEQLQSMLNRDGLEPEQRGALEHARDKLKQLRRMANPGKRETYETVRQIAEALLSFFKRN